MQIAYSNIFQRIIAWVTIAPRISSRVNFHTIWQSLPFLWHRSTWPRSGDSDLPGLKQRLFHACEIQQAGMPDDTWWNIIYTYIYIYDFETKKRMFFSSVATHPESRRTWWSHLLVRTGRFETVWILLFKRGWIGGIITQKNQHTHTQ